MDSAKYGGGSPSSIWITDPVRRGAPSALSSRMSLQGEPCLPSEAAFVPRWSALIIVARRLSHEIYLQKANGPTQLFITFCVNSRFVRADNELDIFVLGMLFDVMELQLPKKRLPGFASARNMMQRIQIRSLAERERPGRQFAG
jgi:hypothetical protein